ncbi:MAG: hypothetical protein SFW67_04540 [Myxococcaceae bacterium]|nr:hypothetical protein [Myxococcaceae bacterium]
MNCSRIVSLVPVLQLACGGTEAFVDDGPVDLGDDVVVDELVAGAAMEDWLIQDVCADGAGRALAVDPVLGCPRGAARRDLRSGEALPYHRNDAANAQRHDSFPRPGVGSATRIVNPFDFAPFNEQGPLDGYDVVETDGAFASIIGTRDPGGLAGTFFSKRCTLDDAWLLFPRDVAGSGQTVARLSYDQWERNGRAFPGRCGGAVDSFTAWRLSTVTFGGVNGVRAKTMPALVVDHHGGGDPNRSDHIERFYFTRVYGLTRWERWNVAAAPAAGVVCNGPVREGRFVRADCRDWTNVVPNGEGWSPQAWATPYAASTRLVNGDFGQGGTRGWSSLGSSTEGRPTALGTAAGSGGGTVAQVHCNGRCSPGQSIFQDVARAGLVGRLRFGATVRSAARSAVSGELVVFQLDAGGGIVGRVGVPFSVGGGRARLTAPAFDAHPSAQRLRFQLYLNGPGTFELDDAWLAPD